MKLAYRYRIYPSQAQLTKLANIFSMCRHLYNWSLEERIAAYGKDKSTISYHQQQNALPELKERKPWYRSIYSQVLQDVLQRLEKAYQRFFRQKKGFPKYKMKGQWSSITYPQFRKRPQDNTIDIPTLGKVKLVYHRDIPQGAMIKTLTIIKEGGKWFACFSIELPDRSESKPKLSIPIGIDLGLDSFIFTSNNESIAAPRYLRQSASKIERLQKKLSKLEKKTPRYMKVILALQKAYYRLRCKRDAFFYHLAHNLFNKADKVCIEDLDIAKMTKRPEAQKDKDTGKFLPNGATQQSRLNRSIYDAGWGTFVRVLKNIASKLGKLVVAVPPQYTSQTCSECLEIVEKSLSTRTHKCLCGYMADRDYNAAKNILRLGLESLGLTQEAATIMPCI